MGLGLLTLIAFTRTTSFSAHAIGWAISATVAAERHLLDSLGLMATRLLARSIHDHAGGETSGDE